MMNLISHRQENQRKRPRIKEKVDRGQDRKEWNNEGQEKTGAK